MRTKKFILMLSLVTGSLLPVTAVWAGIRVGGEEAPTTNAQPFQNAQEDAPEVGGIRQAAPVADNAPKPKYQKGDLLKMAEEFRATYRKDKEQIYGEQPKAAEYRYGFVVAFFDTKSLVNPTLLSQLEQLDKMDGLQFKLIKSQDNLKRTHKDFTYDELKKLSQYTMPLARDDLDGRLAKSYKVDKFPSVLYETPSGEVVRFHVPTTMDAALRRIQKESRLVDSQGKQR